MVHGILCSTLEKKMDPGLYRAAMDGKVGLLKENKHKLEAQVTPNNNTILHIAAMFGNTDCVDEILGNCPSLLSHVNIKGDTAFHIAAREGHSFVTRALIKHAKALRIFAAVSNQGHSRFVHTFINCAKALDEELEKGFGSAKEMLRMTNEDGNTALHDAVQHCHLDVVKLLVREDPEFLHPANDSKETPLYLATEKGLVSIVSEIMKTCTSPSYGGPGGRTALHAAVVFNYEGCTNALLDWKPSLTKEVDMYGWTPLHYAARFGFVSRTMQLLTVDKSLAYIAASKNEKNAALHVAASQGHIGVMKVHFSECPDCWEMMNGRGQNILHIAVEYERKEVIKFIMKNSWAGYLINQKDVRGNTPLHLYASSNNFVVPELTKHHKLDLMSFNKENLTALDLVTKIDFYRTREAFIKGELKGVDASYGCHNIIDEDNERMLKIKKTRAKGKKELPADIRKVADTHLIVAALIATVTFAAGFTLPGGFDSNNGPNQGTAVLLRKAAFKAFVITDVVAMLSSAAAVFLYFMASFEDDKRKLIDEHYVPTLFLILIAMIATMLAFITGLYVALAPLPGLAITVCVIGGFSFLIFYKVIYKVLRSI